MALGLPAHLECDPVESVRDEPVCRDRHVARELNVAGARQQRDEADAVGSKEDELHLVESVLPFDVSVGDAQLAKAWLRRPLRDPREAGMRKARRSHGNGTHKRGGCGSRGGVQHGMRDRARVAKRAQARPART